MYFKAHFAATIARTWQLIKEDCHAGMCSPISDLEAPKAKAKSAEYSEDGGNHQKED
jgi:hypothetical protein